MQNVTSSFDGAIAGLDEDCGVFTENKNPPEETLSAGYGKTGFALTRSRQTPSGPVREDS